MDAEILFEKARKEKKFISKFLNFREFMSICVPLIAVRMKLEVEVILRRLASIERGTHQVGNEVATESTELTPEQLAARKIQSTSRRKSVNLHAKGKKDAENSAKKVNPDFFDVPSEANIAEEVTLREVFTAVCESSKLDMDLQSCLRLCKEGNILNGNFFTSHDVQLVFFKAKCIALNNPAYESGVTCGKRLSYKIFREILIPCITEKKTSKYPTKQSIGEVISSLLLIKTKETVEAESEKNIALKSFFSVLKDGPDGGGSAKVRRQQSLDPKDSRGVLTRQVSA